MNKTSKGPDKRLRFIQILFDPDRTLYGLTREGGVYWYSESEGNRGWVAMDMQESAGAREDASDGTDE